VNFFKKFRVESGDPVTVMYIISKICRAIHTDDQALPEHPRERVSVNKQQVALVNKKASHVAADLTWNTIGEAMKLSAAQSSVVSPNKTITGINYSESAVNTFINTGISTFKSKMGKAQKMIADFGF
jgi:hypothetical protein